MRKHADEKALFFSAKLRERIGPTLRQVILFGSRARGEAHEGSDYDFTVIVTRKDPKIREMVLKTEVEFLDRFDELSSCLVFDEAGWELRKSFPIGINILREGIQL